MKEFQHYDKAANKFYRKQQFSPWPLTTWDLFAQQFKMTGEGLDDVTKFKKLAKKNKWNAKVSFKDEILDKSHIVVVTDSSLNIVLASQNIHKMNGYTSKEVIGKNPKMFQGVLTCKNTTQKIRQAILNQVPFEATVLNYRKDGSTYNCWIKGEPVKDNTGNVVNFIAFEREVA